MEMHTPMYVPLVPIYIAAPQEAWWPRSEPLQTVDESEEVLTDVGSSADTDAPRGEEDWQFLCVYDQPATWHQYEEGLWLKCTQMPLLDACYVETDKGDYRPFGSLADFWRLAECMRENIAVVSVGDMCVHVLRAGQQAEKMALKPGLRFLRCFPGNLGILVLEQHHRRFAYLDATWRRDDKRTGRLAVQSELVMAALRSRDSNHLCFW